MCNDREYILYLESENAALKAALARADYQADCDNCKHRGAVDVCPEPDCDCGKCPSKCVCGSCQDGSCWEWKGDAHDQG